MSIKGTDFYQCTSSKNKRIHERVSLRVSLHCLPSDLTVLTVPGIRTVYDPAVFCCYPVNLRPEESKGGRRGEKGVHYFPSQERRSLMQWKEHWTVSFGGFVFVLIFLLLASHVTAGQPASLPGFQFLHLQYIALRELFSPFSAYCCVKPYNAFQRNNPRICII